MGLLRLFILWRLLRFCVPLIVCGVLLLAVSSQLRGSNRPSLRSVDGAVSRVERAFHPLVQDARRALTRALPSQRSQ